MDRTFVIAPPFPGPSGRQTHKTADFRDRRSATLRRVETLPAAAIAAIVAEIEPTSTVVASSDLPGGLSSFMTVVDVERSDGSRHRLVVRRGRRPDSQREMLPFGVEYELLVHLAAHGVPVARPRTFDDSGRIVPQSYVVYDHVPGSTPFTVDDPISLAVQMADVMALVHDLDVNDPALPALPDLTERYEEWVITRPSNRPSDESLREDLIRRHFPEHWPPARGERCLLHADYFPGNLVWNDGAIAAVIDWEAAALGDPMADVATTRLDLRWAYDAEVAEAFTLRYLATTGRSSATLAIWELVVALRPAGAMSLWASDMVAHGRPDITAATMCADQHAFVDNAIGRLTPPRRPEPFR